MNRSVEATDARPVIPMRHEAETNRRRFLMMASAGFLMSGCRATPWIDASNGASPHKFDVWDPSVVELIDPNLSVGTLSEGFAWAEGPIWDHKRGQLYFSDIPNNTIYTWTSTRGLQPAIVPAGRLPHEVDPAASPGTNGLLYLSGEDSLLICNQDGRSIDKLELTTNVRTVLIDSFDGKKLNSPNDLVRTRSGVIFFTDPPYGLKEANTSPGKEQSVNGVYRLAPDGSVSRVTSSMTFPNGIALSPDERTLYVTQSDPAAPIALCFDLDENAQAGNERLWVDFSGFMGAGVLGLPDGLTVDASGNLFTTGPGGVFIITPSGNILGRIPTDRATANCAFGEDGRTLFITAHQRLLSIRTKTIGLGFA